MRMIIFPLFPEKDNMNHLFIMFVLTLMKKISLILFGFIACLLVAIGFIESPEIEVIKLLNPTVTVRASVKAESNSVDPFEKAVALIKKYETLHQPRHWPLVGYGHKVLPGENFPRNKALSESRADALLRADLKKNCAVFREFGADSLLLGVLAYNIGSGATKRSRVVSSLKSGNRDIRDIYLSYCRYKGKEHKQIKQRRIEEFDALFITETSSPKESAEVIPDSKISLKDSLRQNINSLTAVPTLCNFNL